MAKRREIRNSTAEFLIFQIEGKEQGVEVYYKDKTVWCTQKAMGVLFDCSTDNVSLHLKNIYKTKELKKSATAEKISVVRQEGSRDVNRTLQFYNLDAIISVGYRVNSIRATQFRQWATNVLREYAIRGYVIDRKRVHNGTPLCTKVSLFSHYEFSNLSMDDKLWSTYLHACVRYVEGDALTNSSLRERFGLKETSAGSISRLIKETTSKEWIKPLDPATARRYMKYIPSWA